MFSTEASESVIINRPDRGILEAGTDVQFECYGKFNYEYINLFISFNLIIYFV